MIQKRPLVNDLYTADPSAHVFNDKIYIYPSHDEDIDVENNDNGDQYGMKDYHVYEMQNENTLPRDCGCVFSLNDVPWASKQLQAPDCVEKDGKYYLVLGGLWGGQLDQYRNNKWSSKNKEPQGDEIACTPKIALMKNNMKELAEELKDLVIVDENGNRLCAGDEERRYFEDPWLFKKGDTYYFTYSTGTTHLLCYATSKNIYGPYTYKGKILTPVLGWTTHHSILEYHGKWYLFYHDCERSNGINQKRNIKFREIKFNKDETIQCEDGLDWGNVKK